jgi:ribonucleotide monophosphatase NagD (HAD superfamily)
MAIPQIDGLSQLADRYDAILCDVWGVLIDGRSHFPVAAEALEKFRARGGKVALVTNASRPSEEVRRQLDGLGLPRAAYDDLVSAGQLTLEQMVARDGEACHHLGPPRDNGLFEAADRLLGGKFRRVPLEDADYVVCTGLSTSAARRRTIMRERWSACASAACPCSALIPTLWSASPGSWSIAPALWPSVTPRWAARW